MMVIFPEKINEIDRNLKGRSQHTQRKERDDVGAALKYYLAVRIFLADQHVNDSLPMLLGKALITAGVITEANLQQALKAQTGNPTLTLGEILFELFAVPREVIESHYVNLAIIPLLKKWLQKQLDQKELSDGLPAGSSIADIAITIPSFIRYEVEAVSFKRRENGMYREGNSLTIIERIRATINPLVITTTRQQKIILTDIHLDVNLDDKMIRPDNPGFLSEVKLRLLKAYKEKT